MTDALVIATVPKNGCEDVRVSLSEYRGHALVDVRTFSEVGDAHERRATKKGVALKLERLPALIAALQAAEAEAQARGLLPRGGSAA